ncbi:MAG: hypothetical protein ACXW0H_03780 [Methylobacter sp.]
MSYRSDGSLYRARCYPTGSNYFPVVQGEADNITAALLICRHGTAILFYTAAGVFKNLINDAVDNASGGSKRVA